MPFFLCNNEFCMYPVAANQIPHLDSFLYGNTCVIFSVSGKQWHGDFLGVI